jgi:hypothetical protein
MIGLFTPFRFAPAELRQYNLLSEGLCFIESERE